MATRLIPDIRNRAWEVSNSQGSKVITRRPLEPRPWHVAVPVGDAGARALQSLDEAGEIRTRGKLNDQMNVVAHNPDLHNSSRMASSNYRKRATEKGRQLRVDERQSSQCRPRQQAIEPHRHLGTVHGARGSRQPIRRTAYRLWTRPERARSASKCALIGRTHAEPGLSARVCAHNAEPGLLARVCAHTPSPGSQLGS